MLSLACTMIILLAAVSGWGGLAMRIFGLRAARVSDLLMAGVLLITILACLFAFFLPLNIFFEISVLAVGIFSFFLMGIYAKFLPLFKNRWLAAALLIMLTASVAPPFILDHFGYYVPTVLWLRSAGFVQGIANLELLLGQMSFWHVFQAVFSGFTDPFLRINAFCAAIFLIYSFERKRYLLLLFLPVFFLFLQAPSPDLPSFVCALIIVDEIFSPRPRTAWLFALACFIFAVKPTMIWLPALVFLYAVGAKFRLKYFIPGILVLLIFFIKNLYCFGYLIFPMRFPDFGIPWKPAAGLMDISADLGIEKAYDMRYSAAQIRSFSWHERALNWLFLPGLRSVMNLGLLISVLALLACSIIQRKRKLWILFLCLLLKVVIILSISAQYRFFIDVLLVAGYILMTGRINGNIAKPLAALGIIGSALIISFPSVLKKAIPSFRVGNYMAGNHREQLISPAKYHSVKYRSYIIGNLKFNTTTDYPFCYDTPLPAISQSFLLQDYEAGIFPQLKGKTLREGFIHKKLGGEQKNELRLILIELKILAK